MSNDLTQFKIPVGTRGRWGDTQNSLIDSLQNIENELAVARGFQSSLGANLDTTFATKEYVGQMLIAGPGGDFSSLRVTEFTTAQEDLDKVGYVLEISSSGGVLGFTNVLHMGDGTAASPSFSFLSDTNTGLYNTPGSVHVTTDGTARLSVANTSVTINPPTTINNSLTVANSTLATNQTTFNLINTTATTLNFAQAATTITLGATTGTTTVRNNLAVTGTITRATNTVWDAGNDGAGSGLDADLLDGQQGSFYQNASNINAGTLANARTTGVSTNTANTLALRDASGNFSAGTITAALIGNASTATTLQTSRNINGVAFNGSANINLDTLITSSNNTGFLAVGTPSAVNYLGTINSTAANSVQLVTLGSDTDISLIIKPKGAGAIILDASTGAGQIDLMPGPANVRVWDEDNSHYFQFVTGNTTANYNITLPAGNVTLTAGTSVVTTRAVNTNNGLTGGGDLSADRTLGLTGQALALHNLATNGIIARTAAGTVAARTITQGTGITVTNGDGVAGNPTITNAGVVSIANGGGITVSASTGSITLGSTATAANTANAIVARDASGNFTAGTITANLTGAATQFGITSTTAAGTYYPVFVDGTSGNRIGRVVSTFSVDPSTGSLTSGSLSTTGSATVGTNLTVNGNLVVNGTTTTVNSVSYTVDDPVLTLGGDTPPASDDNKDRGVEFRWHDGTNAKLGFFGRRDSNGRLAYIPDGTNTSEVFTGTLGDIEASTFHGALSGNAATASQWLTARTITLAGDATGSVSIDGSANVTLTVAVVDDSHTHDGRYYTETEADARFANVTGDTFTGQVISTAAYSAANGGGQLYLNAATGNRIDWNIAGIGGPSTTTRSAGTKLTLYPSVAASTVDFAIGIDNSTLWSSVSSTADSFKWYASTNLVGTLSGTGVLTVASFVGALTGNATTATTLQTARNINGVSFNGSADITITANTTNTLTRGAFLTGANFNGSAATTWAVDATTTNTASKVVARDASGNFAAGTITAALSGNATTATTATNLSGGSVNATTGAFSGALTRAGNTVWDAGNDGSGSGLDADLLDGYHASLTPTGGTIPVRNADGTLDIGAGRQSLAFVKYTTAGTSNFVIPAGVTSVRVMVQAAGGAGAPGTTGGTGYGAGGSAGGYSEGWFTVTPGNTLVVTVGAGGTAPAGSVASPVGGNGGNSSVVGSGINIVATGGLGGTLRSIVLDKKDITYLSYLVDGSTATGGDRNLTGGDGEPSVYLYTVDYSPSTAQGYLLTEEYTGAEPISQAGSVIEGRGGDSHFAKWGKPQIIAASSNGRNAPGYGAGGGGATDLDAAGYTGGNGGGGIVVIEY